MDIVRTRASQIHGQNSGQNPGKFKTFQNCFFNICRPNSVGKFSTPRWMIFHQHFLFDECLMKMCYWTIILSNSLLGATMCERLASFLTQQPNNIQSCFDHASNEMFTNIVGTFSRASNIVDQQMLVNKNRPTMLRRSVARPTLLSNKCWSTKMGQQW